MQITAIIIETTAATMVLHKGMEGEIAKGKKEKKKQKTNNTVLKRETLLEKTIISE